MPKMYHPWLMHNYTPVLRPKPPLSLDIQAYDQAPARCIVINESLIPYLLGLLEIYRWPDRFRGSRDEQLHSVGIFGDLVAGLLEGNCMPSLTGIRIENCILQIQVGGAPEWIDVGDVTACATVPTPQINVDPTTQTVNGKTRNGQLVTIDIDGDGDIDESFLVWDGFDGDDGADGAPAPVPAVEVVPTTKTENGQTVNGYNVRFDMNADGSTDGAYSVYDGLDGAPAPVPAVEVVPTVKTENGQTVNGYNVRFDMNADGSTDGAYSVYDGLDGTAAPTPVVTIVPTVKTVNGQTVNGYNVRFDMDADGSTDAAFTVYDGLPGATGGGIVGTPPVDDLEACNVATYFADVYLPTLFSDVVAIRQNNATIVGVASALAALAAPFTGGGSLAFTAGVGSLASTLMGVNPTSLANAATPAFWQDVKCAMYAAIGFHKDDPGEFDMWLVNEYTRQILRFAGIPLPFYDRPPQLINIPDYPPASEFLATMINNLNLDAALRAYNIGLLYDGGGCAICPPLVPESGNLPQAWDMTIAPYWERRTDGQGQYAGVWVSGQGWQTTARVPVEEDISPSIGDYLVLWYQFTSEQTFNSITISVRSLDALSNRNATINLIIRDENGAIVNLPTLGFVVPLAADTSYTYTWANPQQGYSIGIGLPDANGALFYLRSVSLS